MKKKVLFISYYFPPSGSTGAIRPLKFVKYLVEFGWQPTMLTCRNPFDFNIGEDRGILRQIPPGVKVEGTFSFEPLNLFWKWQDKRKHLSTGTTAPSQYKGQKKKGTSFIRNFIIDILHIPDNYQGWVPFAFLRGLKIITREKIDVIVATAPPPSAFIVGYLLSKCTRKPLIIDYRDPWRKEREFNFVNKINTKIEKQLLRHAQYIVSVTHTWSKGLQRKYRDTAYRKYVEIPNGYDSDEKNGAINSFDKFTFLHAGQLYGNDGVADFIDTVFDIVRVDEHLRKNLRILFLESKPDLPKFYALEKLDVAAFENRLPRKECLDAMAKAHVLLVFLRKEGLSSGWIPSKLFDYMMFRKPVLGIMPEGEAKDLIEKARLGVVIKHGDKEQLTRAIYDLYEKHKSEITKNDFNEELIKKYERKVLTKKLADIFDITINKTRHFLMAVNGKK